MISVLMDLDPCRTRKGDQKKIIIYQERNMMKFATDHNNPYNSYCTFNVYVWQRFRRRTLVKHVPTAHTQTNVAPSPGTTLAGRPPGNCATHSRESGRTQPSHPTRSNTSTHPAHPRSGRCKKTGSVCGQCNQVIGTVSRVPSVHERILAEISPSTRYRRPPVGPVSQVVKCRPKNKSKQPVERMEIMRISHPAERTRFGWQRFERTESLRSATRQHVVLRERFDHN